MRNKSFKNTIFSSSIFLSILAVASTCKKDDPTPHSVLLDYYIDSYQQSNLSLHARTQVNYSYDVSGKLTRFASSSYNTQTGKMDDVSYSLVSYMDGKPS